MFKKAEVDRQISDAEHVILQEEIQAIMRKFQTLKERISDLRYQCEELRNSALENESAVRMCSRCGNGIVAGQEVVIKDSTGAETGCYHKECFQELLK